MLSKIIVGLLISMSSVFSEEFKKPYWENITYNQWNKVPKGEGSTDIIG